MDKKTERLSLRTSEESLEYLKQLGESDDRSVAYVINKMIDHFKNKNITDLRDIE